MAADVDVDKKLNVFDISRIISKYTGNEALYWGTDSNTLVSLDVFDNTATQEKNEDDASNGNYKLSNSSSTSVTYYETLNEAVTAAGTTESTIKALTSTTETTATEIASGQKITIDLNGQTVTLSADDESSINLSGELTVNDSGENGTLTRAGGANIVLNNSNAQVIINSGKIKAISNNGDTHKPAINGEDGFIIVKGGTVTGDMGIAINGYNVTIAGGNVGGYYTAPAVSAYRATVTGGSVNGTLQAIVANTLKISGGTIESGGTSVVTSGHGTAATCITTTTDFEMSGGTINVTADTGYTITTAGNVKITGGTIKSTQTDVALINSTGDEKTNITIGSVSDAIAFGTEKLILESACDTVINASSATVNYYNGYLKSTSTTRAASLIIAKTININDENFKIMIDGTEGTLDIKDDATTQTVDTAIKEIYYASKS